MVSLSVVERADAMPELLRTCFSLLVLTAVVHTGLSWALLIAVRRDAAARTELFGSIKTLVLGPKALRLKHIFSRPLPAVRIAHWPRPHRLLALEMVWLGRNRYASCCRFPPVLCVAHDPITLREAANLSIERTRSGLRPTRSAHVKR